MPSKSNKNKWSLPPYPPTAETICIPVTVPNDDRWIGLFLGQLYRLSQQIWYDRDEQHTAKLVAAVWAGIYLETVKRVWACEGDGMFDVRINPEDECSIEKTLDGGVTWSEAFRLDSGCSLSRIIRNPVDGSYGFEIEDVGFWRFPDGPPGTNAVNPPVPAPTHAAAPDPLCAAASNAAMVYVELYKRVADELLDQVASEFELAANLGTAISGFLMIIGAAATQPYVAIASILGLIGVRQQFLDNPLDSDDLERMTCILYDHAVQDAQGSVTFNYDGVFGDVDLPAPKQTLMRLLLGMLGGDSLNAAGAVDIVAAPDCSVCVDPSPISLYVPTIEGGTWGLNLTDLGDGWWSIDSEQGFSRGYASATSGTDGNPNACTPFKILDWEWIVPPLNGQFSTSYFLCPVTSKLQLWPANTIGTLPTPYMGTFKIETPQFANYPGYKLKFRIGL